jgi:UDP-N-acetylglucosamine diphosphorylase/glucosamine-1-phosphate N-acetyltransferase
MPHLILFDNEIREQLLPLTFTRPVADLRVGILTIREKWERHMGLPASFLTQDYLAERYAMDYDEENYLINGSLFPSEELIRLIRQLNYSEALLQDGELLAAKLKGSQIEKLIKDEDFGDLAGFEVRKDHPKLRSVPDIFRFNDTELRADFALLTKGRKSAPLPESNRLLGPADQLFLEEGVDIECATLNTKTGPIYIGRNCLVMEGCLIRGGLAMGEESVLKMGTRIYGATTLGPGCKAGGEISNVVFQANANKGHEGYLGNAVIGEWCNIGAGTEASNLKNNYTEIKIWNYPEGRFKPTGLQFCGLIMGDHSKLGINTMINTGTVIGVCANVFGTGFPRNFVPSFAWGGPHGYTTWRSSQAFDTVEKVMARREKQMSVQDRLILLRIFEDTARYRAWEKS